VSDGFVLKSISIWQKMTFKPEFTRRWNMLFVCLMVFNATFNNISVIS
jgi:hypothetical protein